MLFLEHSKYVAYFIFILGFNLHFDLIWKRDRETQRAYLSVGSLPKCLQCPELTQAEARSYECHLYLLSGGRNPSMWAIPCCFLGHPWAGILPQPWYSLGWNQYWDWEWWCPTQLPDWDTHTHTQLTLYFSWLHCILYLAFTDLTFMKQSKGDDNEVIN